MSENTERLVAEAEESYARLARENPDDEILQCICRGVSVISAYVRWTDAEVELKTQADTLISAISSVIASMTVNMSHNVQPKAGVDTGDAVDIAIDLILKRAEDMARNAKTNAVQIAGKPIPGGLGGKRVMN